MIKLEGQTEKKLIDSFQQFRGKTLEIVIESIKGQEEKLLSVVENQLKILDELDELSITIFKNCILFENGYTKITNSIKRLTKLKNLEINIQESSFLGDEGLSKITQTVYYLQKMTDFSIRVEKNNFISAQSMKNLINSLKELNQIRRLSLTFFNISNDSNNDMNQLLFEGLTFLSNLQTLTISLDLINLNDQDIIHFFQCLQSFKELENLHLVLNNEDNAFIWYDTFIESLREMKKLKTLFLNFNHKNTFSLGQFVTICKTLKEFKELKKFDINWLQNIQILQCFQQLTKSIGQLTNLQELDFFFSKDIIKSKDNQILLGESLRNCSNLQSLSLHFGNAQKLFYDEFAILLKDAFENMKNLKILNIDFISFVSQSGFNLLGNALRYLENLEQLQLDLKQQEIHESYKPMFSGVRYLSNLRKINVILEINLTLDQELLLLDSISHLLKLESLKISYQYFRIILKQDNNVNLQLISCLNNLANLTELEICLKILNLSQNQYLLWKQICVKNLKNLRSLKFIAVMSEQRNSYEFTDCLQYLINIKQLDIIFLQFSNDSFYKLTKSLESLIFLEDISLQLDRVSNLEAIKLSNLEAIKFITNGLRNSKNLTKLVIRIQNESWYQSDFSQFCKLSSLRVLKIIDSQSQTGDLIAFCTNGIGQSKNLQELELCFEKSKLTDQGAKILGNSLENLVHLKSLILNTDINSSQFTNVGSSYLSQGLSCLQSLKEIKLQFKTDRPAQNLLLSQIHRLPSLNQIYTSLEYYPTSQSKIDSFKKQKNQQQMLFEDNQITKLTLEYSSNTKVKFPFLEEIDSQFQFLKNCKHLIDLNIKFTRQLQANRVNFKLFVNQIYYLQNLKSLKITNEFGSFDKQTIVKLNMVLNCLKNLENFSISFRKQFNDCDHLLMKGIQFLNNLLNLEIKITISDQGLIELGNSLRYLTKLVVLKLNFSKFSTFKEEGSVLLGEGLFYLKNLNQLKLEMLSINSINEKGSTSLAHGLSNLKKLRKFEMIIESQNQCILKGAASIMEAMTSFEYVHSIDLYISGGNSIDRYSIIQLMKSLRNLKYLQHTTISVFYQDDVLILPKDIAYIRVNNYFLDQRFDFRIQASQLKICYNQLEIAITYQINSLSYQFEDFLSDIPNKIYITIDTSKNSDQNKENLCASLFPLLKKLNSKQISLNFYQNSLPDNQFQNFCRIIPDWKSLDKLELVLDNYKIDKQNIVILSDQIVQLKELKILTIEFIIQSNLQSKDLKDFIRRLSVLQNLHSLNLKTDKPNINSEILMFVKSKMKKLINQNNNISGQQQCCIF